MMLFQRFPLFNEAGDGSGGGGGAAAPINPAVPPVAPVVPAASAGGDAPVTRAEFDALMAKLDKIGTPVQPQPPQPPKAADMPEWAKPLYEGMSALMGQQQAQAAAAARSSFVSAALADVPEANRPMAQLVVEGIISSQGIDPTKPGASDMAQAVAAQLRAQFGTSLYNVPGSQLRAVPKAASGGYDWSQITSIEQVPAEMIKHIPDDVYKRIRMGGSATTTHPSGGIPTRSRFRH